MELTLSINGAPSEIRRVLDLLEHVGDGPAINVEVSDRRLARLVHWSSAPMVAVMRAVVEQSEQGEPVSRAQLIERAGTGGEAELNGVLGSIGRAWAASVGTENPFLGQGGADGEVTYQIVQDLAARLSPMLAEWTDHGGRRRGGRRMGRRA